MTVEFRLLGNVEAVHDGRSLDLGHARQRSILATLLVQANRPVAIDALVEYVWGDEPPQRGRDVLYSYVSRLRTALTPLPDVAIERRSGAYTLMVDRDRVDLHLFRRLVTLARSESDGDAALALFDDALALWRDAAFADLDAPWLNARRVALDAEYYAAQLDQTDLALRQGRHAELITELTARTTTHPLDERAAGQLMLALYRAGRQADALRHYQGIRERLADELGSDPAPPLRELHQQILTAAASLAAPAAAPAPSGPIPRQLPAAPYPFTGRVDELATLTGVVDAAVERTGTVVISAIAGAGGIGKTWLALHWAHQNLETFPDGQLFVDLRGFAPAGDPLTPATAVRGLLDSLGVEPGRIPVDLDAQIGLYRSEVAGRRMLIVLDNAASTSQVTPLLPGSPTCTVLVTSRDQLTGLVTGHGARPLLLDILTDAEARNLLAARLGADRLTAEPDAVDELLAIAGGFPLALSILAGRATVHPDFPLADLAAELRDTSTRLGALDEDEPAASLPAVLSSSYHALSGEQARVFGLLALAPGPDISLVAAANLTDMAPGRVAAILRVLERVSLIQQGTPGRYRMHDLVRLYAAQQAAEDLPETERNAAIASLARYYTNTGYTGDVLLFPNRTAIELDPPAAGPYPIELSDKQEVLAWFDTEHANLMAVQRFAAEHEQHELAWYLAWALNTYHRLRGRLHDNVTCWEYGADAATHFGLPSAEISAQRLVGIGYAWIGRQQEGLDHMYRALALAEQTDDLAQRAHTHNGISQAWEQLAEYDKALEHATSALRCYQELGNESWEANALNQVGWFSAHVGRYEQARAACEDALTLHRKHNDRNFEAATLDSLAFIAKSSGDHATALDHYRQALALFRELGNNFDEAGILDHIGQIHAALDQPDEARTVWRQALELYQAQGRTAHVERIGEQMSTLD